MIYRDCVEFHEVHPILTGNAEPGNLAGETLLSGHLPAESTVADLETLLVTSCSRSWGGASFFLGDCRVSRSSTLCQYESLLVKDPRQKSSSQTAVEAPALMLLIS